MSVRVLVVEDEELAAEAHAEYTRRVQGFEVAGVARSAADALRHLAGDAEVDLVLLDMHLPDGHGLALLQRLRAAGHLCDVIAVTSARDAEVVRRAVSQGVVLYLIKPFSFANFRNKLEQYAAYRDQLAGTGRDVVQDDVDQLLGTLRNRAGAADLPKGIEPGVDAAGHGGAARRRGRRPVGDRGRRPDRRVPGHRAALPRAPRRRGSGHAVSALRRRRPPRGGLPLGQVSSRPG